MYKWNFPKLRKRGAMFPKIDIGNELCYKLLNVYEPHPESMSCFSWRPSLKKLEIQKLRMPYELWDDEYTIQLMINKLGYYSVVTKNIKDGRLGFCTHIGKNYHVNDPILGPKIIGRKDFPDKINITIKDI
jgi:hypothetical protein